MSHSDHARPHPRGIGGPPPAPARGSTRTLPTPLPRKYLPEPSTVIHHRASSDSPLPDPAVRVEKRVGHGRVGDRVPTPPRIEQPSMTPLRGYADPGCPPHCASTTGGREVTGNAGSSFPGRRIPSLDKHRGGSIRKTAPLSPGKPIECAGRFYGPFTIHPSYQTGCFFPRPE